MKVWFLVLVLTTTSGNEMHVLVEMPDEATCKTFQGQFTYAVEIDLDPGIVVPALPGSDTTTVEVSEIRYPREIEDIYCEESDDG